MIYLGNKWKTFENTHALLLSEISMLSHDIEDLVPTFNSVHNFPTGDKGLF